MSEVVERVARAMQQRAKQPVGNIESLEPVLVGSLGDAWPYLARAAIHAVRDPTDEMIAKAMAPYLYGNDEAMNKAFRETIRSYWQAMIDEALK